MKKKIIQSTKNCLTINFLEKIHFNPMLLYKSHQHIVLSGDKAFILDICNSASEKQLRAIGLELELKVIMSSWIIEVMSRLDSIQLFSYFHPC